MTGYELFAAVGLAEEETIASALSFRPRRRALKRIAAAAACLCVAAAGALVLRPAPADLPAEADVSAVGEQAQTDQMPATNGVNITDPHAAPEVSLPMIEGYDGDTPSAQACYAVPKPGEATLSMPLRAALDKYGGDRVYRVAVDLWGEGERHLDPAGPEADAECARLAELGYTVARETFTDAEGVKTEIFSLHARGSQLESFPPSETLGCIIFLYAEWVK